MFTGYKYSANKWDHVRFKFNTLAGTEGRYDFWIRNITDNQPETYLGQFDYYAPYGRRMGINQFCFSLYDANGNNTAREVYIDNIKCTVE